MVAMITWSLFCFQPYRLSSVLLSDDDDDDDVDDYGNDYRYNDGVGGDDGKDICLSFFSCIVGTTMIMIMIVMILIMVMMMMIIMLMMMMMTLMIVVVVVVVVVWFMLQKTC